MTAYVRVYSANGSVAHLAEPGAAAPLCRARPPRGGWLGTGKPAERAWAESMPVCKHCARERDRIAAAAVVPETPAGGASSADRADGANVPPAGPLPEPLEPLPDPDDPAVRRAAQRGAWKRLASAYKAGQRGDRGRRARSGRGQEYRPGQNRSGGPP